MKRFYVLLALLLFPWGLKAELKGSGTEKDPYLIENEDSWRDFCTYPDSYGTDGNYYKLTTDLVTRVGFNSPSGFNGTFDGSGHTIEIPLVGGKENSIFNENIGELGIVKNLGVKKAYICVTNYGKIENCFVDSNGTETPARICWRTNYGIIHNCYILGSAEWINGEYFYGELSSGGCWYYEGEVCRYNEGTISNCYSTINTVDNTAFFFGICLENRGTITDCYGLKQKMTIGAPLEGADGVLMDRYNRYKEMEILYPRVTKKELVSLMNQNLDDNYWEKFGYDESKDEISYPKLKINPIDENPSGIEDIEGLKVYAQDGYIFVQTPQSMHISVISINGIVVKDVNQNGLQQYDLPQGIYIVTAGEKAFKVINK